jgi:hypothetical protein
MGCSVPLQAEKIVHQLLHACDAGCTTLQDYLADVEQVCLQPQFQRQACVLLSLFRMIRSGGELYLMLISRVLEASHAGLEDVIAELCARADAPYDCVPVSDQSGLLFAGAAWPVVLCPRHVALLLTCDRLWACGFGGGQDAARRRVTRTIIPRCG